MTKPKTFPSQDRTSSTQKENTPEGSKGKSTPKVRTPWEPRREHSPAGRQSSATNIVAARSVRMMVNRAGGAEHVASETPCRILEECQACTLLALDTRTQLAQKTNDLKLKLRLAGDVLAQAQVLDCTDSPLRFAYRHTAKLVVSEKPPLGGKRWIQIGLYKPGSHEVVDIGRCPVQHDALNKITAYLRMAIKDHKITIYNPRTKQGLLRYVIVRTTARTKQTLVTFVTTTPDKTALRIVARDMLEKFVDLQGVLQHVNDTPGNAIFIAPTFKMGSNNSPGSSNTRTFTPTVRRAENSTESLTEGRTDSRTDGAMSELSEPGESVLLAGKDVLTDNLANHKLRASATSFFQVNPPVAERMYFRISELANVGPQETALDLYCGVGGIALSLATTGAKRVVGIEETPSAVADAKLNAEANGCAGKTEFVCGRAEDVLPALMLNKTLERADVVTLNPSRRGCQKDVLEKLCQLQPRAIIYMSCAADTLVRDVKILVEQGYKPVMFEPYDMFPGTAHYEILCYLTKN